MAKSMVIVESPAKARTIGKYLGKDFFVRASAGHVKDLPKKDLGVDIQRNFQPTYKVISGKEKILKDLKKDAEKVTAIYLAADPDREGEAICFHLAEELNGTGKRAIHRVLFNEITKNAVLKAFENPTTIDQNKVEAQQARRILDRLVGYQVSPLLWKKVRKGLSAGRVQTVALRMIVDREKEIRAFKPEEYWNFSARLRAENPPPFEARAVRRDGKKFKIPNQEQANELLAELKKSDFIVQDVKRKERKRNPLPPFITSKLQQDAARQLNFSVKKTMTIAQRLYEGIELGDEGSVGLITYMRTDSTRISSSAVGEVRKFIGSTYGADFLPDKPNLYRSKKGAQDAHEAIRPTSVMRQPADVKAYLNRDEFRLYDLIWKRFVASQMAPAVFDQTEIEIEAGRTLFKAVGSILKFEGFLKVYQEGNDTDDPVAESEAGDEGRVLPDVSVGEKLKVEELMHEQKFTQPPPRYNEASLVKALEEKGIGRPSTYQSILSVITQREYVSKENGRFVPSELGEVVTELLVNHFGELFNYDYTARLEEELDEIEEGKEDWVKALKDFYAEFKERLDTAQDEMKNLKEEEIPTDEICEKCGSKMVIRWGRFGRFMACSNYPECRNTKEIAREGSVADELESGEQPKEICSKCGRPMVVKKGRYGEFLACSGYPECKNTKKIVRDPEGEVKVHEEKTLDEKCPQCGTNLVQKHGRFGEFIACGNYPECRYIKPNLTGVRCPKCEKGELVERKSRRGKVFYGCERYPDCDYVMWNKPLPRQCPSCGAPFLVEKYTKREGTVIVCENRDCDFREVPEAAEAEQPAVQESA